MAKSFHYTLGTMTRRLLKLAAPVKGQLALSTLASVVGNLAQMGLMGFGALTLLACAGWWASPTPWGIATGISAALVVVCRYIEGSWPIYGSGSMKNCVPWPLPAWWAGRRGTF